MAPGRQRAGREKTKDLAEGCYGQLPAAAPVKYALDWRQLATGFALGVVAALLTALQIRQIRRRREAEYGHASVSDLPRKR